MKTLLNMTEKKFLRAMGETLVPSGSIFPPGASDTNFIESLEELLWASPRLERGAVRAVLFMVNFFPSFKAGKYSSFSAASRDVRMRTVYAWGKSNFYPRRMALKLVSSFVYMMVYNDPLIHKNMGYKDPFAGSSGKKKKSK